MFLPLALSNFPKWKATYSNEDLNVLTKFTFVKSL